MLLPKPISNKYGIDLFGMMHFTVENIRCIVFLIYNNTYTFYDQVGFHVIWCQNDNHKQILLEEKPTCYLKTKRYRLLCILKMKGAFSDDKPKFSRLDKLYFIIFKKPPTRVLICIPPRLLNLKQGM